MLVLSRRIGEEIVIDEQIRVVVSAVEGDRVRLGICAPATVRVDRQEVHERRSLLSGSQRAGVEEVSSCGDKEDQMTVLAVKHGELERNGREQFLRLFPPSR